MESRSIFISSCSRRQLARRRPYRSPLRAQRLWGVALVMMIAIAVIAIAGGWL
jgi:hypothetical protein